MQGRPTTATTMANNPISTTLHTQTLGKGPGLEAYPQGVAGVVTGFIIPTTRQKNTVTMTMTMKTEVAKATVKPKKGHVEGGHTGALIQFSCTVEVEAVAVAEEETAETGVASEGAPGAAEQHPRTAMVFLGPFPPRPLRWTRPGHTPQFSLG